MTMTNHAGHTPMTTFCDISGLPDSIREQLQVLSDWIADIDGMDICSPADEGTVYDEGTIDADVAVKAFNALASECDRLRLQLKKTSDALLKVRPLGGSELFVRFGDKENYADPDYCGKAIDELHRRHHDAEKRAVLADRECDRLRAENERLREALESCESWIDRWTRHVGNCAGNGQCTCGRSAVLGEARAALSESSNG